MSNTRNPAHKYVATKNIKLTEAQQRFILSFISDYHACQDKDEFWHGSWTTNLTGDNFSLKTVQALEKKCVLKIERADEYSSSTSGQYVLTHFLGEFDFVDVAEGFIELQPFNTENESSEVTRKNKTFYLIIDEDKTPWRTLILDELTLRGAADGYLDIYRINGDVVDKIDPDGTWSPIEWDD